MLSDSLLEIINAKIESAKLFDTDYPLNAEDFISIFEGFFSKIDSEGLEWYGGLRSNLLMYVKDTNPTNPVLAVDAAHILYKACKGEDFRSSYEDWFEKKCLENVKLQDFIKQNTL